MKNWLFIIFFPFWLNAQKAPDSLRFQKLKLVFGGDIMCHGPQLRAAYNDTLQSYNFDRNYSFVNSIFSMADYVLLNLETTIGVKPYSGYPQFSAPPELLQAIKKSGINVLMTANNHACDKRKKGIVSTLDFLDSLNFFHAGTYRNPKERKFLNPLILKKNGIKIAVLNYTYGTNGIPTPYPTIVDKISLPIIKKDLEKTRKYHPDIIIAFLHWGEQYHKFASKQQKKLADFLHKHQVDLVIGSHPHVIQPMEIKRDSIGKIHQVTIYSLGNFISNQRKYPRDGSVLVQLTLAKNPEGKIWVDDFQTIPLWVYKYYENKKTYYLILPVKDFILQPDFFKQNSDYQKMMKFYKYYQSFEFEKL